MAMQQELSDSPSDEMASAIEESLREFWGNWGHAPQSELLDQPGMLRLYTGVPYAFFNAVICTQLSPQNADEEIEATISYYARRNASWEWAIGPKSNPAYLGKALERHGLACCGEDIGMAIDLDTKQEYLSMPSGVRIIRANDDETLKLWANTMIEGFQAPALYPTCVDLEVALGSQQTAYRRYLGFFNYQPISTCALLLGKRVAGIYCVSTLPTARRLGIGAAITQHALKEAKASGYHVAVLQSSPMGHRVYRRLGFQEYSTLRMYSPVK